MPLPAVRWRARAHNRRHPLRSPGALGCCPRASRQARRWGPAGSMARLARRAFFPRLFLRRPSAQGAAPVSALRRSIGAAQLLQSPNLFGTAISRRRSARSRKVSMKLSPSARSISLSVLLSALLALSALPTGCSGSDVTSTGGAGSAGAPSTDACTVDDDCTFTEIDTEISKASQCMCLYGCVYLPVTKITNARRMQQHEKFCKPDVDGEGNSCGIDDCVVPGTVACVDGACKVSSTDPAQ